jgi:hypothetical protein
MTLSPRNEEVLADVARRVITETRAQKAMNDVEGKCLADVARRVIG